MTMSAADAPDDGDDIVRDLLLKIKAAALRGPLTDTVLLQIERDIRTQYGGEARYIARHLPVSVRNRAIEADLAAGHSKRETARRNSCSLRTVQRLAKDPSATFSGDGDAL